MQRQSRDVLAEEISAEIELGEDPGHPVRRALARMRARMHAHPALRRLYLVLVAILGGAIVVGGVILIPLPGPGWLIVFLGLAVLGTEFAWAHRVSAFAKRQLLRFWAWWKARRARRAAARADRVDDARTPVDANR